MFFILMTITFIFYVSSAMLFVEELYLYGGICLALAVTCTIILLTYYRKQTKKNCPDLCMHGSIPDCDALDCDGPDCFNCN
ncbi:hypothetical protein [Priestia taiwanensis]|uniref:Uncharacterized protein n=1 Tax=Priestia taiwanensis TaxID=1347902 RepID=A0A917AJ98_9BACI|nr:hypothetical protein [Priestia taiwanensis]MBM7361846.1 putative signal transduction protein with EAL and GGDEF domain [Priestia taiwanensis]GGE57378.1 hypothetical protein GCM10007140_04720 [Priestia taiwanensis]